MGLVHTVQTVDGSTSSVSASLLVVLYTDVAATMSMLSGAPLCAQVASKLDPADKETIEKAVDETVEWLDSNQLAEVRFALLEHAVSQPLRAVSSFDQFSSY